MKLFKIIAVLFVFASNVHGMDLVGAMCNPFKTLASPTSSFIEKAIACNVLAPKREEPVKKSIDVLSPNRKKLSKSWSWNDYGPGGFTWEEHLATTECAVIGTAGAVGLILGGAWLPTKIGGVGTVIALIGCTAATFYLAEKCNQLHKRYFDKLKK